MKPSTLEKICLVVLAVIFGGIVFHAPLSVGFGVLFPDFALLIKSWKEILMVVLVPLICVIVSKRHAWKKLVDDWLFRIIVGYSILHLLLVVAFYQGAVPALAGLAIDLRYILFFSLVYVMLRLFPSYQRLFIQIGIAGAFVVVGFATVQLFLPADILTHIGYSKETIAPYLTVDRNPDYIRVNSTLRGPNPVGAYAGMVLALVTAAAVSVKTWRSDRRMIIGGSILAVCSAVALWISYSRSALVAGLVAVAVVLAITVLRRLSRKTWIVFSVVLFSLLGALVAGRDSSFVSNVLLHENPNGGSEVSSNDEHVESLQDGLARLIHQPLGAGVGSTGSASLEGPAPTIIENQYLFIAHETGWIGLLLFMVIFVAIMSRLWRGRKEWLSLGVFASGIGLALIGLLLPVWADDVVSIVWWGLAAMALARRKYERKTTK